MPDISATVRKRTSDSHSIKYMENTKLSLLEMEKEDVEEVYCSGAPSGGQILVLQLFEYFIFSFIFAAFYFTV